MQRQELMGEAVFVVRGFPDEAECAAAIEASESQGYEEAPITMGDSSIVLTDYRDNMRVIGDDPDFASCLFLRIKPFLPQTFEGCSLVGLNERLRYYRYDVGQNFAPHYDGSFRRNEIEESKLTFMVYLNEDCEGGSTDFYSPEGTLQFSVQPEKGMALVFRHELLHGGAPVSEGRKYVIRTDVMYRLLPNSSGRCN